jgi:hypothetical protein
VSPLVLVIAIVVAAVVLIPTRRLQLAGRSRDTLTTYFVSVWLLGVVVALEPAPTRFLVPILLVAYLAPFITVQAGIDRLFGNRPKPPVEPERPPIKNVTPPQPPDEPRA